MNKFQLLLQVGLIGYAGTALAADDKGQGRNLLERLDTNGDELVSLIEFESRDNNQLAEMDTDQNGVLTVDEFINHRPNMGMRMGRGERPEDGQRGQREPDAEQMARMQELRTQRATARFAAMDTDGDEIVTLQEFHAGRFAELDRNRDGVLVAAELRPARMDRPGPDGGRPRAPRGVRTPNGI